MISAPLVIPTTRTNSQRDCLALNAGKALMNLPAYPLMHFRPCLLAVVRNTQSLAIAQIKASATLADRCYMIGLCCALRATWMLADRMHRQDHTAPLAVLTAIVPRVLPLRFILWSEDACAIRHDAHPAFLSLRLCSRLRRFCSALKRRAFSFSKLGLDWLLRGIYLITSNASSTTMPTVAITDRINWRNHRWRLLPSGYCVTKKLT